MLRFVSAYDIGARMKYSGLSLAQAVQAELTCLQNDGGKAGLVSLDAKGNCAISFNTSQMYRGYITKDGDSHIAIVAE